VIRGIKWIWKNDVMRNGKKFWNKTANMNNYGKLKFFTILLYPGIKRYEDNYLKYHNDKHAQLYR
jgi:hypothetical protein